MSGTLGWDLKTLHWLTRGRLRGYKSPLPHPRHRAAVRGGGRSGWIRFVGPRVSSADPHTYPPGAPKQNNTGGLLSITQHPHYVLPQQTRAIHALLVQCWATVYDAGPTLNHQWVNGSCLLGSTARWYFFPLSLVGEGAGPLHSNMLLIIIITLSHGDKRVFSIWNHHKCLS